MAVLRKDKAASNAFVVAISTLEASDSMSPSADGDFKSAPLNKIHCRPDCICIPATLPPKDMVFFDNSEEALKNNYKPCLQCHPDLPVQIDSNVIQNTVNAVNASLNIDIRAGSPAVESPEDTTSIVSPAMQVRSSFYPQHRKAPSQAESPSDIDEQALWTSRPRRASIANGHIHRVAAAVDEFSKLEGKESVFQIRNMQKDSQQQLPQFVYPPQQAPLPTSESQQASRGRPNPSGYASKRKDERASRGEGEHVRLVGEACMHIAAAAAAAAAQAASEEGHEVSHRRTSSMARASSLDPSSRRSFKLQRKKRRGGILGFKELAAKAGLSPWHFHRVFRSVTGLTPKAYGDACWNTVTSIPPEDLLNNKTGLSPTQTPSTKNALSVASSPIPNTHSATVSFPSASNPTSSETSLSSSVSTPNTTDSMQTRQTTPSDPNVLMQSSVPQLAMPQQHLPHSMDFSGLPAPNDQYNLGGPYKPVMQMPIQHTFTPQEQQQFNSIGNSAFSSFVLDDETFNEMQSWPEINSLPEIPNIDIPGLNTLPESVVSSLEPSMYMMNIGNGSQMGQINNLTHPMTQQMPPMNSNAISGNIPFTTEFHQGLTSAAMSVPPFSHAAPNTLGLQENIPVVESKDDSHFRYLTELANPESRLQLLETSLDAPVFDDFDIPMDPEALMHSNHAAEMSMAGQNVMGSTAFGSNQMLSVPTNGANTPIILEDHLLSQYI